MNETSTAILHYSASPVIGGVEAVIDAHVHLLTEAGYSVAVIAGQGEAASFPESVQVSYPKPSRSVDNEP